MKVRIGFVSNSSSSSFVLAGVKIKADNLPENMDALYDKFTVLDDGDGGAPDGYCIIGRSLAHCEDWGLDYTEVSWDKLNQLIAEVEEAVKVPGERGIFTGTRSC